MAQRNNGGPSKAGRSQTEFVMLNLFQYNFLSMRAILKQVQDDDNGPVLRRTEFSMRGTRYFAFPNIAFK